MDTKKHIVDLESFREMLHISPRVPGQSFAELPFEEEILEFLRFLRHSAQIKILTDVNVNKLYQHWRSFAAVINKCLAGKSNGFDSLRHQNTQQYGAILPIELTTEDIKNTTAYKEYYACATGEAAPKPKASARKKKGGSAASTTPLTPIATPTPTTTVVVAPRLSAAAKGTGSKPGVLDVPSDDSEEEISWNSSDDEDVDTQTQGRDQSDGEKTDESDDDDDDDQEEAEKVNDDDDNEEEVPKIDEHETTESDEGDNEATESDREKSEDDDNNEEDQGLRIGEEERMHEKEEADELYRDVDINQGMGLQVSQETEDSHVILTLTQSDAHQESSSTSSFMTNLLNPLIDPGMESIFTTGSTTVTPIPSPQSTMTPSIISTFTTASQLPTPDGYVIYTNTQEMG
nr:hypothetical protein [Tanacetum cinerariifolium]